MEQIKIKSVFNRETEEGITDIKGYPTLNEVMELLLHPIDMVIEENIDSLTEEDLARAFSALIWNVISHMSNNEVSFDREKFKEDLFSLLGKDI